MVRSWRRWRWKRRAIPHVVALHEAQGDLIADIGEPAPVLLESCARIDRAITRLERFLDTNPCPDPDLARSVEALIGACSGLWASASTIARRVPWGMDAGAVDLPDSFVDFMGRRITSLERAWSHARRLSLV